MGQAVDIPLVYGAGNYIVMEQGDSYYCREAGVVSDAAGKLVAGTVMTQLKANRTVNQTPGVNGAPATGGTVQNKGEFVPYYDGADNAVILWQDIDARVSGAKRTLTVRDTQVQSARLTFGFAATDSQLLTAYSLLAAVGIIQR